MLKKFCLKIILNENLKQKQNSEMSAIRKFGNYAVMTSSHKLFFKRIIYQGDHNCNSNIMLDLCCQKISVYTCSKLS